MISTGGKCWFTAAELADLALPGLPRQKRKINERAADEFWAVKTDASGAPLARTRQGRGGGTEFHHSVLPAMAKAELVKRGIPADAEGAALTRVMIENCSDRSVPVVRWALPDEFKNAPADERRRIVDTFLREKVRPHLDRLDGDRRHDLGQDFARSGDGSVIIVNELGQDMVRRGRLVIELRNVPYETQRDVVFYIGDALPRFGHAAFDATGNGAYLAEVARQRWGERVSEVKLNAGWYGANSPPYIEAFADGSVVVAGDDDIIRDHQALQYVDGIIRVPEDFRYKGGDGFDRHGDAGIAGILVWFASRQDAAEYGYEAVPVGRESLYGEQRDEWFGHGDSAARDWWRPPLGTRGMGF